MIVNGFRKIPFLARERTSDKIQSLSTLIEHEISHLHY